MPIILNVVLLDRVLEILIWLVGSDEPDGDGHVDDNDYDKIEGQHESVGQLLTLQQTQSARHQAHQIQTDAGQAQVMNGCELAGIFHEDIGLGKHSSKSDEAKSEIGDCAYDEDDHVRDDVYLSRIGY